MLNPDELNTYIKLKYFPIEHTYEYLIKLPDVAIDQIFYYLASAPLNCDPKDFKKCFINEYVVYNVLTRKKHQYAVEKIIVEELFKHYSENMHSTLE